jgi:cysteine desulfurase / selenocysteine lyase
MATRGSSTTIPQSDFDVAAVRRDFPLLHRPLNGRPPVYLDNAATTQKPEAVLDRIARYYRQENANIHRGVYRLSEEATQAYEDARGQVASFLNAADAREIVFVRGATEAINLVAATYGRTQVGRGDNVVLSAMEHHSNIVPWQVLCDERGARLQVIPISDDGELDVDRYAELLTDRTRLVSVSHVSNALGTINPVQDIVALAHQRGIPVLVDGAQAVGHIAVDVRRIGCDFYACSGHKMLGPTGIGLLYGRWSLLEAMPPYQTGGDMITSVSFDHTGYQQPPHRYEAGTPHIAGAIGLAAAIAYVDALGVERIASHEKTLVEYATVALARIAGLRIVGTAPNKTGIVSFVLDGVHPHDIATILDRQGVAIRAGHHCCQPLMDRLGVPATARASFACYNTRDDVDALATAVSVVREVFG